MGKFFGRLFGTEKALLSTVDGVKSGLDKLFFTKEEKAEHAQAMNAQVQTFMIQWMTSTQGQNLTRRFLALMIAFTWLFQYLVSMILNMAVIWIDTPITAAKVQLSATTIGGYADGMTGAMMLILGFYFAAPHLGGIIGPAMERFGRKPVQPTQQEKN